MNPTTLSLPLLLLLLPALPPSFSDSSDDQPVLECAQKSCGTVTNIIYPFWVSDEQPPYCGFPEFELHCDANTLFLQKSDIKYYVQEIFYPNHSILVVPELDLGSPNSDCPLYQNLSFINTPFSVSATNMDLLIIYNCTVPQQPFFYKAPCAEYNLFTFLGSNSSELERFEWFQTCEIVEIPVLGFPGANASDYNRLVKNGFLLEWSAADCSDCSSSGGQCGYNVDRNSFMCICKDRTHSRHCSESSHHKTRSIVVFSSAVVSSIILLFVSLSVFWVRRRKGKIIPKQLGNGTNQDHEVNGCNEQSDDIMKDQGLRLFTFSTITSSTNNFSYENKIGEGGFGPVYKGILNPNGQEIAVKRLSKGSSQGVDEFQNEIKLIANVQHKNLVRLLGCCIKDAERMLVYEYMPNKSLDHFLFDPVRAASLDWTIRVRVIHGVAQGLLYLHKYSRLRIIHRDLKSGNILLDSEMNPKISDFGISRIFGGNQDLANTNRVVGTYGYMPPEYVMEGRFSEKSDVFSFGVLLLEIVSGKRNCGAPQVGDFIFLTGYVWRLWEVGHISEMMDPVLHKSCPLQDLIRYVHVGLLCVQEEASERPTMSTVISFLSSELLKLPKPKGVAFFTQRRENVDFALLGEDSCLSNELTITAPNPR